MQTPMDEREIVNSALSTPFELLTTMQTNTILYAVEPPEQQEKTVLWSGVGFSLDKQQYVMQIGEVTEILPVPGTTSLPGVKPWVKGVANVRGRLISVLDLTKFLGLPEVSENLQNRIMVVERKDLLVGLIVDDVQGMLQFPSDAFSEELPDSFSNALSSSFSSKGLESVKRFTLGCYQRDIDYIVFNTEKLINSPDFLMAASE